LNNSLNEWQKKSSIEQDVNKDLRIANQLQENKIQELS
jgi:hypothetical protein